MWNSLIWLMVKAKKRERKLEVYFLFLWDIINTNIKLSLCLDIVDHIGPVLKKVRESYSACVAKDYWYEVKKNIVDQINMNCGSSASCSIIVLRTEFPISSLFHFWNINTIPQIRRRARLDVLFCRLTGYKHRNKQLGRHRSLCPFLSLSHAVVLHALCLLCIQ